MFNLIYLPKAKQDILHIAEYIGITLANPSAAERLLNEMESSVDRLREHPYSCPVHHTDMPFEFEYRKLVVHNYLFFYYVNESDKTVTIARVIYGRRDYRNIIL